MYSKPLIRNTRAFSSEASNQSQELLRNLNSFYDKTQVDQMQDMITLVDEQDKVVGPISKFDAHAKTSL